MDTNFMQGDLLLGAGLGLLMIAVYILTISFIVWMCVDAAKHDKFWWLVVVIALPIVGAIVYYFTEKKKLYFKLNKKAEIKSQ